MQMANADLAFLKIKQNAEALLFATTVFQPIAAIKLLALLETMELQLAVTKQLAAMMELLAPPILVILPQETAFTLQSYLQLV